MSEGPRIQLGVAQRAAAALMYIWDMAEPACMVVGSVRRGRETVGDLEFIAPHAPRGGAGGLFDPAAPDALFDAIDQTVKKGNATVVRGLKPHFLAASLTLRMKSPDGRFVIPVQVFRYTPANRGWVEIMRTGPDEFGRLFLHTWKEKHGITEGQASIDGHLVDRLGMRVSVASEAEAFEKCGLPAVEPRDRARYAHMRSFS